MKKITARAVADIPAGGYFWVYTSADSHWNLWSCPVPNRMRHVLTCYPAHGGYFLRELDHHGAAVPRNKGAPWSGEFRLVPKERWAGIEMAVQSKLEAALIARIAGQPKHPESAPLT